MDDNLNVKLTDFGFATEICDDEELYGRWSAVLLSALPYMHIGH